MITDKEFEKLHYVEKTFETEDYITTTAMLVDDDGKIYHKYVITEPTKADNLSALLIHDKFRRKLN